MRSRPGQEQLLASLQDEKNRLQYLSHNDWMLLLDRAQPVTFKKGDVLVQQASESKTLFIIAAGKVRGSISGKIFVEILPGEVLVVVAFFYDSRPSASATG